MFPNSTLGQSPFNPKASRIANAPDTDSRAILFNQGEVNVVPNLMHDHTRLTYVVPSGNLTVVSFTTPINTEERGLHWLTLDNSNNSNNGASKTFQFSADYEFLDDLANTSRTYIVSAGKKIVWYGVWYDGKIRLRVAAESTN